MQHLLLLHGALGARDQLSPLGDLLANDFYIHRLNFSGHGGEPMKEQAWSIAFFTKEVIAYIDTYIAPTDPVYVFGYSMGGYVAMYLGRHYPGRTVKTITLATKFHWDDAVASREVKMLDAATIQQKVPAFAAILEKRHGNHAWKEVLLKTGNMLQEMGKDNPVKVEEYAQINAPCLLLLGDRDKMVTLEETVQVYKQLPVAQLGVLPGTPHALEQVDVAALSEMIRKFIQSE